MTDEDLRRFRANRQDEIDSAAAMAEAERDAGVAKIGAAITLLSGRSPRRGSRSGSAGRSASR